MYMSPEDKVLEGKINSTDFRLFRSPIVKLCQRGKDDTKQK